MEDLKYKIIKIGGNKFAIIKVLGSQTYTISKHNTREEAGRALEKLKSSIRTTTKENVDVAKALNVSYAKFSPIEETGKKDTLESNVRKLHRLGPKKDSDKRKSKRYGRILKRIKTQMENKRVDPDTFKPQFTGKKLTDAEREASKSHYAALNNPEKSAKLDDDRDEYKKKKQKEMDDKRKAAGGLADMLKNRKKS